MSHFSYIHELLPLYLLYVHMVYVLCTINHVLLTTDHLVRSIYYLIHTISFNKYIWFTWYVRLIKSYVRLKIYVRLLYIMILNLYDAQRIILYIDL